MIRWNPFAHLVKTKKYRSSHIIGSSLWQRIKDTFKVFHGGMMTLRGIDNDLGLLDYLFPFARVFANLFIKCFAKEPNAKTRGAAALLLLPMIISLAVKFIAAALLTVAVFPLVMVTHLLIKPFAYWLHSKILHLKVSGVNEDKTLSSEQELSASYSQIRDTMIESNPLNCPNQTQKLGLGFYSYRPFTGELPRSVGNPISVIAICPENYEGIMALLKTNSFWAVQRLEQEGKLEEVEQALSAIATNTNH